jgi:hypothetical protein
MHRQGNRPATGLTPHQHYYFSAPPPRASILLLFSLLHTLGDLLSLIFHRLYPALLAAFQHDRGLISGHEAQLATVLSLQVPSSKLPPVATYCSPQHQHIRISTILHRSPTLHRSTRPAAQAPSRKRARGGVPHLQLLVASHHIAMPLSCGVVSWSQGTLQYGVAMNGPRIF